MLHVKYWGKIHSIIIYVQVTLLKFTFLYMQFFKINERKVDNWNISIDAKLNFS